MTNKKQLRHTLTPAASLLMAGLAMAGCGGGGGGGDGPHSPAQSSPAVTAPAATPVASVPAAVPDTIVNPGTPATSTPVVSVTPVAATPVTTTPVTTTPVTTTPVTTTPVVAAPATTTYEAESNFFSGGAASAGTYLQAFSATGARVIFTVNAAAAGAVPVALAYANGTSANNTLNVYVNGVFATTTTLPPTGGATAWSTRQETLALRAGVNTITYQKDAANTGLVNIDAVSVQGGIALAARGATLPYQEYEAETGASNVAATGPTTAYGNADAEASGRRTVTLSSTGHYVEWVAQKAANALTVRYSMADATAGGGTGNTLSLYVDGAKVRTLDVSSRYAWVYGDYPFNNNPATGNAHRFFDESSVMDLAIPAGAKVRLQKDAGDTASYYKIDLVDLEQVDAAYAMPANFIAVTSYGAVANDGADDTAAINQAIAAARSTGKGVWLPAGTFNINAQITVSGVHVRGAGMWRTRLAGSNGKGGFVGRGSNVVIADLALDSDATVRNDSADSPAFEGNFGPGSLIQNVWVEHMKVGFWAGNGTDSLLMVGGRIRDTWADGVNLAGGVRNTTIAHFNFRNTGDDAMAMWSSGAANVNNTFRFNTAQSPNLANTFAIYGGQDNKILDNIGADTVVSSSGIAISTRFQAVKFSGTTEVRRNTLNRTGGYDGGTSMGALWIYADPATNAAGDITAPIVIDTLAINDSTTEGILFSDGRAITNLVVSNVTIANAGTYGLNFRNVTGSGSFSGVQITGTKNAAVNNPGSKYTIVRGSGNSGW
ncbi:MAG TPA: glycosyl hydrolase family 28-related protein [Telluria sp.]